MREPRTPEVKEPEREFKPIAKPARGIEFVSWIVLKKIDKPTIP
jgi:hypothetical protein